MESSQQGLGVDFRSFGVLHIIYSRKVWRLNLAREFSRVKWIWIRFSRVAACLVALIGESEEETDFVGCDEINGVKDDLTVRPGIVETELNYFNQHSATGWHAPINSTMARSSSKWTLNLLLLEFWLSYLG